MQEMRKTEIRMQKDLEDVRQMAEKASHSNASLFQILRSLEAVECVDLSL